MIDRKLLTRLVLPLVGLALVSMILIWPLNLIDVFTNLIIEIVGILITIGYVEWILTRLEKEKWEETDILIRADFAAYVVRFASELTLFLVKGGWNPPDPDAMKSHPTGKLGALALEHISSEEIIDALVKMERKRRESFASQLDLKLEDLRQLYARYSYRLSAEYTKMILELEGSLMSFQTYLSLIDDETTLSNMANPETDDIDLLRSKQVKKNAASLQEVISYLIQVFDSVIPHDR
jgi:hypothetical protein